MSEPAPTTSDPRRRAPPPPRMVLVDRRMEIVDEFEEIMEERGDLPLNRFLESAVAALPADGGSQAERAARRRRAMEEATARYRAEQVEEKAMAILLERRRASRSRPGGAMRKEPLAPGAEAFCYGDILDGVEVEVVEPRRPVSGVTRLSLRTSWPPSSNLRPYAASVESSHRHLLVLRADAHRAGAGAGHAVVPDYYLIYDVSANSVAVVPPPPSRCRVDAMAAWEGVGDVVDAGGGVAVLVCSKDDGDGDYVLAELFLCTDARSRLPTNTATLSMWERGGAGGSHPDDRRQWVEEEVVLPLPRSPAAGDATTTTTTTCSFHADMVLAVSSTSLCWVDLLAGILVYNHIDGRDFHFIPLPEECAAMDRDDAGARRRSGRPPEEYRSMCCVDRQTLRFVSMDYDDDGYSSQKPCRSRRGKGELMTLTTWTLRRPLSPTNWRWEKDAAVSPASFRVQNLLDDTLFYNSSKDDDDDLKLQPSCPVMSTQQPGIVYLTVTRYKYGGRRRLRSRRSLEDRGSYVLSVDMDRGRVESAYEVPLGDDGIIRHPRLFTSDFTSYLNTAEEEEEDIRVPDELGEGAC